MTQWFTMGSMKVHHLARGLIWEHEPSLTLGFNKRLRPLAPKLQHHNTTHSHSLSSFDLNTFIRPESGPRKLPPPPSPHHHLHKEETQPGGTRWNPTQEQIGILEMLYRSGMRTPNAEQIEQITVQLAKYGKIEGKNVFYWFQNHKARERQKLKRNPNSSPPPTSAIPLTFETRGRVGEGEEESPSRKRCRSLAFECFQLEESRLLRRDEEYKTLELFPLHPEGR